MAAPELNSCRTRSRGWIEGSSTTMVSVRVGRSAPRSVSQPYCIVAVVLLAVKLIAAQAREHSASRWNR